MHIFQWDEELGCIPFSTTATGVWTATSSASIQEGSYFCAHCGRPMNRGGTLRHIFRHTSSADEARCNKRVLESAMELPSLGSPQLSVGLRHTDNSFSLYLSFYSLVNGSAYPPEAKIIIRIGKRNAIHAASLLARNKGTMLRTPVPASQYTITYQGFREGEAQYWPEKVDGPDPDGAFFDSSYRLLRPGTRIPLDRTKVYYFITVRPLEETSPDLDIRHICMQPQNDTVIWNLYRVSVKRFSLSAATFFLDHAIFPTTMRTALTPVWPPCVERQNFLLHHAGSLYFTVSDGDASLRTYPPHSLRRIKDISSKTAALYQVSGSKQDLLLDGGADAGLGYYWCRKTALRGNTTPPEITLSDIDGNPLEGDSLILPGNGILTVRAPYNGMVRVWDNETLWCVYPLEGNQDTTMLSLKPDMELQIYQGTDLVRTIHLAALPKPIKASRKKKAEMAPKQPEIPTGQDTAEKAPPPETSKPAALTEKTEPKGAGAAPAEPAPEAKPSGRRSRKASEETKPAKGTVPPEIPQAKPAPAPQPQRDSDTALLARLQACSSCTIPIPHAFGACAPLFSPAVQRWIAGKVREQKIPADAYRLLVHESNLRRGGRSNGR